jgi:hypothetical protein
MKLVSAIVKPFKLEEVREALSALGVQGMTVTQVRGSGGRRATPRFIAARIRRKFRAEDEDRHRRWAMPRSIKSSRHSRGSGDRKDR